MSRIVSPEAREVECRCLLPSRCDSTRRSVQSPKPVEILSKKSPEKLLLPHPTDLDLDTFRPNDAALVPLLLGLSSIPSTTTTDTAGGGGGGGVTVVSSTVDEVVVVVLISGGPGFGEGGFLLEVLLERWRKDQKPFLLGLKLAVVKVAVDLLLLRSVVVVEEEETAAGDNFFFF